VIAPLEYATNGAPGGGRSVFGLVSTAAIAVVGFHPSDVTSRLLALWPLCILVAFLSFGRRWSSRGGLLIALATAPFLALLIAEIAGAPRQPTFALGWVATSIPMLAIGAGRALSLAGNPSRVVLAGATVAGILTMALLDQSARVQPVRRFDLDPVMTALAADARAGDTVVYAPLAVGDLVRYQAPRSRVVALDDVTLDELLRSARIEVVGAFALGDDQASARTVELVQQLSKTRRLVAREGTDDVRVWVFQ
jgi:hypothetical protein